MPRLMRPAEVRSWVDDRGGVLHSSDLRAAGITDRAVRAAVEAGLLTRVRRSWLVSSSCDPPRRAAASASGRLTCVSAAESRGLWVPRLEGIHIAVPGTASRFEVPGARIHWSTGPAPVRRNTVDDHPLNMLFHVANCLPPADALAVWESALKHGVVDRQLLGRVAWRSTAATKLAGLASDLSDSGLETRFLVLARDAGIRVRQQVRIDGHPVDGLIGSWLVVQLDGFAHHGDATARRRDIRDDARLTLRGYTVFRFDYAQVFFEGSYVIEAVSDAMAQGLHLRPRR